MLLVLSYASDSVLWCGLLKLYAPCVNPTQKIHRDKFSVDVKNAVERGAKLEGYAWMS